MGKHRSKRTESAPETEGWQAGREGITRVSKRAVWRQKTRLLGYLLGALWIISRFCDRARARMFL